MGGWFCKLGGHVESRRTFSVRENILRPLSARPITRNISKRHRVSMALKMTARGWTGLQRPGFTATPKRKLSEWSPRRRNVPRCPSIWRGLLCSRMIFERQDGAFAVIGVAIMIAVGELRPDFSQIARPDWLAAQHTERLRTGRSAIHQYESHVAPPNAKQNTVSDACKPLGGGAQRWFLPSGLSLFRSTFSGGTGMYFPSSLRFA